MGTIEIFSTPVKYKFKSRLCSISTLFTFLLKLTAIVLPFLLAFEAGGFWLHNRTHIEIPRVQFTYKYLLIAERQLDMRPTVCSSFSVYKKNKIPDDCSVIKLREVDLDKDKQNDMLNFEIQFYADEPVRSFKLALIFQFELKDIIHSKIESLALIDCIIPHDAQRVHVIADLKLKQRRLLRQLSIDELPGKTLDLSDYSLPEILSLNARQKFSAEIINSHTTWETGYSSDEPTVITGEVFYSEQVLHYQPRIWEELKWAWIQYLSLLIVFLYATKRIVNWLLLRSYLRSYLVIPWRKI